MPASYPRDYDRYADQRCERRQPAERVKDRYEWHRSPPYRPRHLSRPRSPVICSRIEPPHRMPEKRPRSRSPVQATHKQLKAEAPTTNMVSRTARDHSPSNAASNQIDHSKDPRRRPSAQSGVQTESGANTSQSPESGELTPPERGHKAVPRGPAAMQPKPMATSFVTRSDAPPQESRGEHASNTLNANPQFPALVNGRSPNDGSNGNSMDLDLASGALSKKAWSDALYNVMSKVSDIAVAQVAQSETAIRLGRAELDYKVQRDSVSGIAVDKASRALEAAKKDFNTKTAEVTRRDEALNKASASAFDVFSRYDQGMTARLDVVEEMYRKSEERNATLVSLNLEYQKRFESLEASLKQSQQEINVLKQESAKPTHESSSIRQGPEVALLAQEVEKMKHYHHETVKTVDEKVGSAISRLDHDIRQYIDAHLIRISTLEVKVNKMKQEASSKPPSRHTVSPAALQTDSKPRPNGETDDLDSRMATYRQNWKMEFNGFEARATQRQTKANDELKKKINDMEMHNIRIINGVNRQLSKIEEWLNTNTATFNKESSANTTDAQEGSGVPSTTSGETSSLTRLHQSIRDIKADLISLRQTVTQQAADGQKRLDEHETYFKELGDLIAEMQLKEDPIKQEEDDDDL